jgi:hypothetical protein
VVKTVTVRVLEGGQHGPPRHLRWKTLRQALPVSALRRSVQPAIGVLNMFSRNKQPPIKSLIAEGSRIEGNVLFTDGLRIDGEVVGDVRVGQGTPACW